MKKVSPVYAQICAQSGLPEPVAEFQFHGERKWRFDYAWVQQRVALEVEGGIHTQGAHARPGGILRDMEKYNYAQCMGWIVIRCVPKNLHHKETFGFLKQAMIINSKRTP